MRGWHRLLTEDVTACILRVMMVVGWDMRLHEALQLEMQGGLPAVVTKAEGQAGVMMRMECSTQSCAL